ncbi:MAG TPA: alpha/beta hydrolase-fold protein, partial [Acidimicrobiia bacterium]|nr:alpha/beta hydrolase-fold protein [Acidimicrobiia bacterium]
MAIATLAVGLASARGRWLRLVRLALGVGAGMAAVAWLVARLELVDFTYPASFYVWVGLVVFAAGAAAIGWRRSGWWRRIVALSAVVVTFMMAATLINEHYAYFPTPAALFGQVAIDEVPASHIVHLSATGRGTPARDHGAVITVDLPARISGFTHRDAVVYLPPVWFTQPRPALPVIMMLTGTPSLVSDWTRAARADQIADDYAADHHGWAPILVFPDPNGSDLGDTECVDSPQGQAETYLTRDVPADVVAQFGSAPPQWAVAGLSEGGMCAALLTLRHPEVFSAFADFSGEPAPVVGHDKAATMRLLFGGSQAARLAHDPLTLLGQRRYDG